MSNPNAVHPDKVGKNRVRHFLVALISSVFLTCAIVPSASALPALGLTSAGNTFNSEPDWEAIQRSGATVFRMQFNWEVVAANGWVNTYDQYFEKAAKQGITILPYLYGAPEGRRTFFRDFEPGWSGWLNTFVWQAVSRYAENGTF